MVCRRFPSGNWTPRPQAQALVWKVFKEYEAPDYTKTGVEEFYRSIHDADYLAGLRMFGAYAGERLVGVIATRSEGTHIALFFVDGAYHRRGVGRRLFQTVSGACRADKMTVHSSPYAVTVYHKFGFRAVGKERTVNGLRFTPMERTL